MESQGVDSVLHQDHIGGEVREEEISAGSSKDYHSMKSFYLFG